MISMFGYFRIQISKVLLEIEWIQGVADTHTLMNSLTAHRLPSKRTIEGVQCVDLLPAGLHQLPKENRNSDAHVIWRHGTSASHLALLLLATRTSAAVARNFLVETNVRGWMDVWLSPDCYDIRNTSVRLATPTELQDLIIIVRCFR